MEINLLCKNRFSKKWEQFWFLFTFIVFSFLCGTLNWLVTRILTNIFLNDRIVFSLDGLSFQRPEIKIDHNLHFD